MDQYLLVSLVMLLLIFCIPKIREQSFKNLLLEHVSWCMTEKLEDVILSKSVYQTVDPPYQLCCNDENEMSIIRIIIDAYKDDLSHSFFKGLLSSSKSIVNVTDKEYFFLTLDSYLRKHECDWDFKGNIMHEFIETEYYDGDGSKEFSSLTHFGIVYTKLLYLVASYCISCRSLNSNHVSIDSIEYLKNEIESKTITTLRFRP